MRVQVHKRAGAAATEKLLPRDLNPKIREQVNAAVGPTPSPAAMPPPQAVQSQEDVRPAGAPEQARRASSTSSSQRATAPQLPPLLPVAAPPDGVLMLLLLELLQGLKQSLAYGNEPRRGMMLHGCAELPADFISEDPTPYQLELISKEQILGPSHPEVGIPFVIML